MLLDIENLRISFNQEGRFIEVLRGVSMTLNKGEILGIIGESGSGKTVTASSLLRLHNDGSMKVNSGTIMFNGEDLLSKSEKQMRKIRGKKISYIFQDASGALNPYMRVGKQLLEVLQVHKEKGGKERILSVMEKVGIDNAKIVYDMYPNELSGGLAQRVMIAMCTIGSPDIIIADEPTTAIDASLQKRVLSLLKDINSENGTSIIVITHDFDVAKFICSRVLVMYGGLVMEESNIKDILENPLHPYTKGLIKCMESLDNNERRLHSLDGRAPSPLEFENSCPFYMRCPDRKDECSKNIPDIRNVSGRLCRCIGV